MIEYNTQNGTLYFINRDLQNLTPTSSRPFSSDIESLKKRYEERLPIYKSVCDVEVFNNEEIEAVLNKILGDVK